MLKMLTDKEMIDNRDDNYNPEDTKIMAVKSSFGKETDVQLLGADVQKQISNDELNQNVIGQRDSTGALKSCFLPFQSLVMM